MTAQQQTSTSPSEHGATGLRWYVMLQSGQAAGDTGSLRLLAEHVQATLMQPVEQLLLVDYPLRSPPAADDADDPGIAFKLDEVSVSLKVGILPRCWAVKSWSCLKAAQLINC
jgi:hypothetical protein